MSVIVASGEQISKSPLNKSTAKQMYTFPRSNRFENLGKASTCSTFYYNLPSVMSTRSASLGKGGKYDFTRIHKGKNSTFYNTHSDFDTKHPHGPAFTFGASRQLYEKVYYESNKMLDKDVPGPGKYDYLKPFGNNAVKYSIHGGKSEGKLIPGSYKGPGPGQYPIISLNPNGKYPVSNFKNTTGIVWGMSKEKRFDYSFNKNPGPDTYKIGDLINGKGFVFPSKFKSSTAKSMSGRTGENFSKSQNPGPGSYRTFSEFGIYESKLAAKPK